MENNIFRIAGSEYTDTTFYVWCKWRKLQADWLINALHPTPAILSASTKKVHSKQNRLPNIFASTLLTCFRSSEMTITKIWSNFAPGCRLTVQQHLHIHMVMWLKGMSASPINNCCIFYVHRHRWGEATNGGIGEGINPHLPPGHLWDVHKTDEKFLGTSTPHPSLPPKKNVLSHQLVVSSWWLSK